MERIAHAGSGTGAWRCSFCHDAVARIVSGHRIQVRAIGIGGDANIFPCLSWIANGKTPSPASRFRWPILNVWPSCFVNLQ